MADLNHAGRLEQGSWHTGSAASFLFLLSFVFVQPASAFDWYDRNAFALANPGRPLPDWVWESEWVAGAALRGHWKAFEPSKGRFNWEYLDSEIAKAAASGKVVTIRIWGGAHGTPDWVYEAGAQGYEWTVVAAAQPEFGRTFKAPLPWDPVWLGEWIRFISALGKKFNSNPHVVGIVITGPVGPYGEMVLPRSQEMKVGWRKLGWGDDKLFAAYKACIDAFAEAVPDKRLALSFSRPGDEPAAVAFRIYEYARKTLGNRLMPMMNALSGTRDYRKFRVDSRWFHQRIIATICKDGRAGNPVGFQQLAPRTVRRKQKLQPGQVSFGGRDRMGIPEQEIANVEGCDARYVEMYLADLRGGPTTEAYMAWVAKGGNGDRSGR